MTRKEVKKREIFDLYGQEDFLCSEEDLQRSVRLRVLRLRTQQVPEFKGLRLVPSVESQVLKKILEVIFNLCPHYSLILNSNKNRIGLMPGLSNKSR